jgi:hypothetical protein
VDGEYSLTKSKNTYTVCMTGNEKIFSDLRKAYWYITERLDPKRKTLARLCEHNIFSHIFCEGRTIEELLNAWALSLIEKMYPYDFEVNGNDMIVYTGIPIPAGIPAKVKSLGYRLTCVKVLEQYRASPKQE